MLAVLALSAAETLINQWLDLDLATRTALDRLAGKRLRVQVEAPWLAVEVLIDAGKLRLEPTPTGQAERPSLFEQRPWEKNTPPAALPAADLSLQVPNLVVLARLATQTPTAGGTVPVQGDVGLLQQLQRILAAHQPEPGHWVSHWLGDQAGGVTDRLLGPLPQQLRRQGRHWLDTAQEWLREDSGLLAPRWQMQQQVNGVRTLRTDLERLDARLRQLEQQQQQQQQQQ